MAQVMGELDATVGDVTYRLRLTMRGIAQLQDEYGLDLEPILGIKEGHMPNFGACLRVVEIALQRYHADAGVDAADDILSADMSVFGRLISVAFPDAQKDGDAQKKRKAAVR